MSRCADCYLHKTCMSVKIPMERGSDSPRILFVGEAPGEEEDRMGRPFIGRSGELLRNVLRDVLPDGVEPWITNAVKCRPPKNQTPSREAFNACDKYLWEDIEDCNPDIVVPLGASALQAVLRKSGITALRGRRFILRHGEGKECPAYPTYHPAYILRSPGETKVWIEDLQRATEGSELSTSDLSSRWKEVSIEKLYRLARAAGFFAYDVESNNRLNWVLPDSFITQLGFCTELDGRYYVAGGYPPGFLPSDERAMQAMFADSSVVKVGHNKKFDMAWIRSKLGIIVAPPHFCTMTAYYVGVSEELSSSLKTLAYLYTEIGGYEEAYQKQAMELPEGYSVEKFLSLTEEQHNVERTYNFADCYVTAILYSKLRPIIDADEGFRRVFYDILMPVYPVLVGMESNGIAIDSTLYRRYTRETTIRQAKYAYAAWESLVEAGVKGYDLWYDDPEDIKGYMERPRRHPRAPKVCYLNLNSPKQLQDILYKQLGLPVLGVTPKGEQKGWAPGDSGVPLEFSSTAKGVMAELVKTDQGVGSTFLKSYRAWKAVNTAYKMFLKPLPGLVDEDWVVHPKYTPMKDPGREYGEGAGTKTGRLSSANPNFQQLPRNPVPDENGDPSPLEGISIRSLYCSRFPGGSIIAPDFSQIELRWAAILGNDKRMIAIFNSGGDVHTATAAEMFGISIEEVTKEQRRQAKAINFGILYGKGPYSLAEELGISVPEAEEFIARYFSRFSGVKAYIDYVHKFVKRNGYLRTYFGRMRRLSGARSDDNGMRAAALREAVNCNPQGSASDMALISLIRIQRILDKTKMRTVLCGNIHDALVLDAPPEETERACRIAKTCMEDWGEYDFPIPIVAEVEVGPSLGQLEKKEIA